MSIMTLTTQDSVAVITLTNGENRQNPQFAKQLKQTLAEVAANQNHKALVITSNDEKCWSLGIDTDWLLPAMQAKRPMKYVVLCTTWTMYLKPYCFSLCQ